MTEDDIRAVLADEAAKAVPGSVVVERLRAHRRRRGGLVALVAAGVMAVVAAVAVPLAAGRDPGPAAPPATAPTGPVTVVVIGLDGGRAEQVDGERADTVLLVRVDGAEVSGLSLPRDAWVDVPGHGKAKLSLAHAVGGPDAVVAAVEELTGQQVDHYAAVDMAGFERLATAVGGVEVCLRAATSDRFSGADFPAGKQRVAGAEALAFLRQRRGLPNGDFDRVVRHQVFAKALLHELATTVLTDPARREELTALVRELVRTDPGWNPIAVAAGARGPLRLATIPIADSSAFVDGQAVLVVDPEQVRRFAAEFFTPSSGGGSTSGGGSPGDGCVN